MRSHAPNSDRKQSSLKSKTVHACYTQPVHALRRRAPETQSYRGWRSGHAHGRTSHPLRHRPQTSLKSSPIRADIAGLHGIDAGWR